jgi:hypothetical protein
MDPNEHGSHHLEYATHIAQELSFEEAPTAQCK